MIIRSGVIRRLAVVTLLTALVSGTSLAKSAPDDGSGPYAAPGSTFSLKAGRSAFWLGETVRDLGLLLVGRGANFNGPLNERSVPFPLCGTPRFPCWDYFIDAGAGGGRLRVAADSATQATFALEIYDPAGNFLGSHGHFRSVEMFVDDPVPGRYLVRVIPMAVPTPTTYRMRAKLERPERTLRQRKLLAPNLRSWFDLNIVFGACEGETPIDEAEDRCLRFGVFTENNGDGLLDLRLEQVSTHQHPTYRQRLYYSDGTWEDRVAGTHTQLPDIINGHLHFHIEDVQLYELFRVTDPATGGLERIVGEHKVGWCMEDAKLTDWERFYQDPVDDDIYFGLDNRPNNCGFDQREPVIALTRGWGDLYATNTPGQFVPFGDAPDGEYVIRATADVDGFIVETNEHDNVGYTHISVTGNSIAILERGRGTDPWDPNKVVLDEWWN